LPIIIKLNAIENFKIMKKLGNGSYSEVYRVLRISDGIEYAIK
jgi:serine/threonine protein kinase